MKQLKSEIYFQSIYSRENYSWSTKHPKRMLMDLFWFDLYHGCNSSSFTCMSCIYPHSYGMFHWHWYDHAVYLMPTRYSREYPPKEKLPVCINLGYNCFYGDMLYLSFPFPQTCATHWLIFNNTAIKGVVRYNLEKDPTPEWRHDMKTLCALLDRCERRIHRLPIDCHQKGVVMPSFDAFFHF